MLVEGGTTLLENFISEDLWDEARIIVNPNKKFKRGIPAPLLDRGLAFHERSGTDDLFTIKNPH